MAKNFFVLIAAIAVVALVSCSGGSSSEPSFVPQSSGTIRLQWDPPDGSQNAALQYEVYQATYPDGNLELVATTTDLEYTVSLPEGQYMFAVRAKTTSGTQSAFSDYVYSHMEGYPQRWYVRFVKAEGDPKQIFLQ